VGFPDPATFQESYRALGELLDEELAVDWTKTVVGGFSQGTAMSYAVGLGAGRPAPAGILALSGFIPSVPGWQPSLEDRTATPVLIGHGSQDPVIPVEFARQARDFLEAGGLAVTYRETPMGHTIDPRMIPEIAAWLDGRF
jgi:phospholipase/carboxylesterase